MMNYLLEMELGYIYRGSSILHPNSPWRDYKNSITWRWDRP